MVSLAIKLSPPYHAAARRSIRAFSTSPIACILSETGLPTLQEQILLNTLKLIPKVLLGNNSLVLDLAKSHLKRKKIPRNPSAIARCLSAAKELGIPTVIRSAVLKSIPPWQPLNNLMYLNLIKYRKSETNPAVYQQHFIELATDLQNKGWKLLYSDASKSKSQTAYAVVDSKFCTISTGNLFDFCSIYTAEAVAILQAVEYTRKTKGNWVICTDSLSTINSLVNVRVRNRLLDSIRHKLLERKGSTKIMWIPGHVDIRGNEAADQRAKLATKEPLRTSDWILKDDIIRLVRAHTKTGRAHELLNPQHHYAKFITTENKLGCDLNISFNDLKCFTRLRIGHTIITHSHIFKGESRPSCPFCNLNQLSVIHLLDECQHFINTRNNIFGHSIPSDHLKIVQSKNIVKILKYLELTNLKKLI